MSVVEEVTDLFNACGQAAYHGEAVSQTEHALQAAYLAEQDGAADALVVAALLHDIGHLIHGLPENIAQRGVDGRHEEAGAAWLSRHFGPDVTEPVRLHVAAKRYLCAVVGQYLAQLSPASKLSLTLQGGAYAPSEVAVFEQEPHYREAVRLRRYDDQAKVAGMSVPPLEHYRDRVEAAARLVAAAEEGR
jgi:phosphonate degradation associated HDIG domain protein